MSIKLMERVVKVEELQKQEASIMADINQYDSKNDRPLEITGTPIEVTQQLFERRRESLLAELDARDRLVSNLREQRDELNKRIAAEMAMRQRAHTAMEVLENALVSLKTVVAASVDELFSRAYAREKLATEDRDLPRSEENPRQISGSNRKRTAEAQRPAAEEVDEDSEAAGQGGGDDDLVQN